MITEEHMVLLLQLQSNSSTVLGSLTPTQTTSEQQPPKGGEQMIPIYAMVLLSLALILLIVVCTVTGSFFCYSSRQRCLQKTKPKMPTQGDEESIISKTSKPASDGPAMTYTHSRKIRRSKSSVQLLMQKAAEISRQNHLINATQDDTAMSKCNLRRSHSLPDLTKLGQQSSTSSTAPVVTRYTIPTNITSNGTARVATVKPISHKRPTQSPTISNPQLTDETLDMKLDKWRKSWLPQPVKGGAGWYERHKSRQIALASYAQLYLAAGAKTPEPGVSPSTKL